MVAAGYISQSTADRAGAIDLEALLLTSQKASAAPRVSPAPHFVDTTVIALLKRALARTS